MLSTRTGLISMLIVLLMLISAGFGMYISWNYSGGAQDSLTPDNPPAISEERPVNVVVTGNANLTISYLGSDNEAKSIDKDTILFGNQWTPGHKEVVYLTITNNGENNVNYSVGVNVNSETGSVNIAGEEFKLSDHLMFGFAEEFDPTGETDIVEALSSSEKVSSGVSKSGTLSAEQNSVTLALVVYLPETSAEAISVAAGNKVPEISLGLSLLATQPMSDNNSAELPELPEGFTASTTVTDVVTDGVLSSSVTIGGDEEMGAILPEGVKLQEGVTDLTFSVNNIENSEANVNLKVGNVKYSLDVHVEGVATDNGVPVFVVLSNIFPKGLTEGNIKFYHVENGETVEMVRVASVEELDAHNEFYYDIESGSVVLAMASFSEITVVIDKANPWDGKIDVSWFTGDNGDGIYYIEDAADLAGLSAIVGGMKVEGDYVYTDENGDHWYTFAGETIYLKNDINLATQEGVNKIFYPIGYWNNTGEYNKVSGGSVSSTVYSFEGTFDGDGHKISNIYQNTWDMFGDYNSGYSGTPNHYKDGMGLFGYVYNGTVRNLIINNFQSDGEFTPTGCVAAYAAGKSTFEDIRVVNSNPRVYNTGNGGIVGVDANKDSEFTFNNIKVEGSTKISALWGSWDVACGGIIGRMYNDTKIAFNSCTVTAEIDVFNDVCGNYQYYQYRYCGMLIGTAGTDSDPEDQIKNVTAEDCFVFYGDWKNYYYCELVENTIASYTHDHQMSRLTKINSVNDIKDGDNWAKTGNFIVVGADGSTTCYHIRKDVNGFYQHSHSDYNRDGVDDYQVVDGESVLVEDKQCVYIPFNQLYTGYGWGSAPSADGITVNEYKYSITYINNSNIIAVEYVADNTKPFTVDADGAIGELIPSQVKDGKTYKFAGWINTGSTPITEIEKDNTKNIVLYPSFEGLYTAIFVDQQGNILDWETFTNGKGDAIKAMKVGAPEIEDCVFDYWQVRVTKDGKTTYTKLSEYKFKDEVDVTIYPIYTFDGDVNLVPVDNDGDGITDEYHVGGYNNPDGQELVEIPDVVNGIKITAIQANAFSSYKGVHVIVIPTTITTTGGNVLAVDWGIFGSGQQVTIYYAGSYNDENDKYSWVNVSKNFAEDWHHGLGTGSRIFFLNGTDKVDPSQGYLEYTHKGNGLWQSHSGSWSDPKTVTNDIKLSITEEECNCNKNETNCTGVKPDIIYWTDVVIP